MTLAALVDLGADKTYIQSGLSRLSPTQKLNFSWKKVNKLGVSALKFNLLPPFPEFRNYSYKKIRELIEKSNLDNKIEAKSIALFHTIAVAEAKIHNKSLDQVHFHEIGAIDSIIDVVGVCLAMESLGVQKVFSSRVSLGNGFVKCQHGNYPVPAMATLEILKSVPVRSGKPQKELTTPTGAAILVNFADEFVEGMPDMSVEKIGYGAGTRDLKEQPNVLRVLMGKQ